MILFLFYIFLFYLFYKLLFDFIIPVFRTTRRVRRSFREMHEQMNPKTGQPFQKQADPSKQPKADKDDYIDFEEIKG
jgi:hypothetical protein